MIANNDDYMKDWGLATKAVHGGRVHDPLTRSCALPIYQTASYTFDDADQAARVFGLEERGNIYTRVMNPTTEAFERQVAELEGGVGSLAVASGQAAVALTVMTLAQAGDEVVASRSLYGGSYCLFSGLLRRFGVTTRFVDASDHEALVEAINSRTRAVFAEAIGNPQLDVLDVEAISGIAHDRGVPLVVDNSVPSPALFRPLEWGADIVVASATKFVGGHGAALGGYVSDAGSFDWERSGRFPLLAEPDPAFLGRSFAAEFGRLAFIARARLQALRDLGSCLSPANAVLLAQGAQTLPLRMNRHCANASKVARELASDPRIAWVNYPGLPSSRWHDLCLKYMGGDGGAIICFGLKGGYEAGRRFVGATHLVKLVANFGDAMSLVIHPASTSHRLLSSAEQLASGVTPELVRLSVGIEDVRDIIADITQALEVAI